MPVTQGGAPLKAVQQDSFSMSTKREHPSVVAMSAGNRAGAPALGAWDSERDKQTDVDEINDLIANLGRGTQADAKPAPGVARVRPPASAELATPTPPSTGYATSPSKPAAAVPRQQDEAGYPAPAAFLSEFENELVREINRIRMEPQEVARDMMENRLPHFKNNDYYPPFGKALRTREGPNAVHDAIAQLNAQRPERPLQPSSGMSKAAKGSVEEAGRSGSTNSDTIKRLHMHGTPAGHCMELMGFGDCTAKEMIWRLFICDGDPNRAQRKQILQPKWKKIGIALGDHKVLLE
jgi:uncharacterized protein YkwD